MISFGNLSVKAYSLNKLYWLYDDISVYKERYKDYLKQKKYKLRKNNINCFHKLVKKNIDDVLDWKTSTFEHFHMDKKVDQLVDFWEELKN